MDKIKAINASLTRPPGQNQDPRFVAGWCLPSGTPLSQATIMSPEWVNDVQDELLNVLADAGITPDRDDLTQLSQAIQVLAGHAAQGAVQAFLVQSGAPGAGDGQEGDFYIDDSDGKLYGPKQAGSWGAAIYQFNLGGASPLIGRTEPHVTELGVDADGTGRVTPSHCTAVGANTLAWGVGAVALGDGAVSKGDNSLALGFGARVEGESEDGTVAAGSIVVGHGALSLGKNNTIIGNSYSSGVYEGVVLIGGKNGDVSGSFASVIGGVENTADYYAVSMGGQYNKAYGSNSAVVGGMSGEVIGNFSGIFVGEDNEIDDAGGGHHSVILGGKNNLLSDKLAGIVGGSDNEVHGGGSVSLGGIHQKIYGNVNTIAGSNYGEVRGQYSALLGGGANTAGSKNAIGYSIANGGVDKSVIVGGSSNRILQDTLKGVHGGMSVVVGGFGNEVYDEKAAIIAGEVNTVRGARSVIIGGEHNLINTQYTSAMIASEECEIETPAKRSVMIASTECVQSDGELVTLMSSANCDPGLASSGNRYAVVAGGVNTSGGTQVKPKWLLNSADGQCYAANWNTSGLDYAELWDNLVSGEIVPGILIANDGNKVRAAREGDDLIGAVSVAPGILGGVDVDTEIDLAIHTKVAHLGRVELKVSEDVKVGDYLCATNEGYGKPDDRTGRVRKADVECLEIRHAYDPAKGYGVALVWIQ